MATKTEVLRELRYIRRSVEFPRVRRALESLSEDERCVFDEAWRELGLLTTRFQTARGPDVRERFRAEETELRANAKELERSLEDTDRASAWPSRMKELMRTLERVVGVSLQVLAPFL